MMKYQETCFANVISVWQYLLLSATVQINKGCQVLGCVSLLNTWRDTCASQQQKLYLILKDYTTKKSFKCLTEDQFCQKKKKVNM
jgi:hypothetical protein